MVGNDVARDTGTDAEWSIAIGLEQKSSPVIEIDGATGSVRSRWTPKKSKGRCKSPGKSGKRPAASEPLFPAALPNCCGCCGGLPCWSTKNPVPLRKSSMSGLFVCNLSRATNGLLVTVNSRTNSPCENVKSSERVWPCKAVPFSASKELVTLEVTWGGVPRSRSIVVACADPTVPRLTAATIPAKRADAFTAPRELNAEVRDAFSDNFFNTFAVTPPMSCIEIRTRNSNHADGHI